MQVSFCYAPLQHVGSHWWPGDQRPSLTLTASMPSDPTVFAQDDVCTPGTCTSRDSALQPDTCTVERGKWCSYHFPKISPSVHSIPSTPALIGNYKWLSWKPAAWDVPHSHWYSSIGLEMPRSYAGINLELLPQNTTPMALALGLWFIWGSGAPAVLCCY